MNRYKRKVDFLAAGLLLFFSLSTGFAAAQAAGKLTLTLQPSLDGEGDIKATSITGAILLGPDGSVVATGNVSRSTAQFDLSGISEGDYFIRVNGLSDDLVPTRIDDQAQNVNQFVGQKLRVSIIGNLSDPTYRVLTFSKGQGEHPVVVYSDGSNEVPEQYAYALLLLKTDPQNLEINVLGTASQLNIYQPSQANHPSTSTAVNPTFAEWMLGEDNHANDYNGTDSKCNSCHINFDMKPTTYVQVTTDNGWCYRCHYGKAGIDNGFIDVSALAAMTATPTAAVTTAAPTTAAPTTAVPTATPSTPAFEAALAISAILLMVLVRRR